MQMDQSKFLNQQGAAIETFRNEMKSTFSPIIPVENQLFTKEPIQINESIDN